LLKQAEVRLQGRFEGQPELQLELLTMLASGYIGIGDFDAADLVLRQAIDRGMSTLGPKHTMTLRARASMTTVHRFRGRIAEMESELQSVREDIRSAKSVAPSDRLIAVENSAHLAIDQGRFDDAQTAALEARELAKREFGDDDPSTVTTYLLLAVALSYGKDQERALEASEQALRKTLSIFGGERPHARVLDARAIYGRTLGNLGRYQLAVDELSIVVRDAAILLGPDAPIIGYYSGDISKFSLELGDLQGALAYAERSLQVLSLHVEDDAYSLAVAHYNLGRVLLAMRRADAARASLQSARIGMLETRGAESPVTRNVTAHIALALALLGHMDEAQQQIDPEIEYLHTASGMQKFHGLHFAGIIRRLAKQWPAAAEMQREAITVLDGTARDERRMRAAETELVLIALDAGDHAGALELVRSWTAQTAPDGPATPADADRQLAAGRAYLANDLFDDALAPLTAADAYWREFAPQSQWAIDAAEWLEECRTALGRTN
jgi:tetratricopeptide (TPR) repeat protein